MEGNSQNDFDLSTSKGKVHCKNTPSGLPENTHIVATDENYLKNKMKSDLKDEEVVCKKRRINNGENSEIKLSAEGLQPILKVETDSANLLEVVPMPNNNFELNNRPEKPGVNVLNGNLITEVYSSGCNDKSSFDEEKNQSKENADLIKEKDCSECNLEDNYHVSPDVLSFSEEEDHDAICICKKLNNEETFPEAINILTVELKKGDTDKVETSFISMLQCINNHVMELQSNKDDYEIKLKDSRKALIKHFKVIMCNLSTINQIYSEFLKQCSNNFTLAQKKKSIKLGKTYAGKLRLAVKKRIRELNCEENQEVDFYDKLNNQLKKLQEDQSSLRCRLTEMIDQLKTIKSDHKRDFEHLDQQLADTREDTESYQQRIRALSQRRSIYEREINELRSNAYEQNGEQESMDDPHISQNEARMISLACIFLSSHPGASIQTIYSYLNQIDSTYNIENVEDLLRKFSTMFQEEVTSVEGHLQKKWYYLGLWQLEHTLD